MFEPPVEEVGWIPYRESATGRTVLARLEGEGWTVSDGFTIRSVSRENFAAAFEKLDV